MSLYPTKSYTITKGPTEFEILKASHKFLREEIDDTDNPIPSSNSNSNKTWEEQLAERYYQSLYREFALCDLKHYKSGHFALRWRTETEVISELGESTCANTRCKYHHPISISSSSSSAAILFDTTKTHKKNKNKNTKSSPQLTTLELPFTYIEQGESKSALVKVVLCPRCFKKLMWKRTKEKEDRERLLHGGSGSKDKKEGEEEERGGVSNDSSGDDYEDGDELKKVDVENKAREKEKEKEKEMEKKKKKEQFRSEMKEYSRSEERLLDSHSHSRSREDMKKRYEHERRHHHPHSHHHGKPDARYRSPRHINTPDTRPRSRSRSRSPRRIDAHTHYRKRPRSPLKQ